MLERSIEKSKGTMQEHTKQQLKVLIAMYLGYGAMMICRQMVTILGPAILADESLSITKTNLGDFAAYGTIGALVGKLIWGPLSDRIGGRQTFLYGISLTAVLVIAFGFSPNVMSFTIFSALIYGLKSSGWPGLTKLVGNWYHPLKYGRVWGVLSTSSRASVVLGTLFFGWLLGVMSWRYVAVSAALIALLICVFCYFFLKESPEDSNFLEQDCPKNLKDDELVEDAGKALEAVTNHPLKDTTLLHALGVFFKSHRVWLVAIMMMMLTCLMAFLDFVSLYLMEVYQLTPSEAAVASSVFPTGSLTGLVASIAFYDRFSKRGLRRILTIALVLASICILTLKYLPAFEFTSDVNYIVALVSIFLFGLSISPAYYIPMSIFSIEFGGQHSATLVCLLDAFGFGASATFGFVGGRLADSAGGWDSFMTMIVTLVLIATFSVWAFMHAEYRAFKKVRL